MGPSLSTWLCWGSGRLIKLPPTHIYFPLSRKSARASANVFNPFESLSDCDLPVNHLLAATVWELLTARVAFKGLHYGAIIEHVALLGERPPLPAEASEDFCLLMSSCWHADAAQRPAFDQVRGRTRCYVVVVRGLRGSSVLTAVRLCFGTGGAAAASRCAQVTRCLNNSCMPQEMVVAVAVFG